VLTNSETGDGQHDCPLGTGPVREPLSVINVRISARTKGVSNSETGVDGPRSGPMGSPLTTLTLTFRTGRTLRGTHGE